MHNLSQMQLLRLWMELEDALMNANRYGGDTAEIYAYTLRCDVPTRGKAHDVLASLKAVLDVFCKLRECRALIDGVRHTKYKEPLVHRVHVRIKSNLKHRKKS